MGEQKVKLRINNISKEFKNKDGKTHAIENVSLDVYDNEFLVLLGPGHCGKTVFLNILAGLEQPTTGEIYLDGEQIFGNDPRIGMVFQKWSLLPWKTVMENTEIGPKFKGVDKSERRKKAQQYIDLVGLHGFENSYPSQLSGGMKQRVGIARAYATNSDIILMDEPFGALDAQTRYQMQDEILRIWQQKKVTVVFITNNVEEAVTLGDRIVLLSNKPCQVVEEFVPDLPRPRNNMDPRFLELRNEIASKVDLAL